MIPALVALPRSALALTCFLSAPGVPPPPGSTLQVDLSTRFATSAQCVYGLDADPRHQRPVPAGETDFASLAARFADPSVRAAPFMLYASVRQRPASGESVFRAGCTEALLGDREAPFHPHGDSATQRPVIDRVTGAAATTCGADRLSLRLVPLAGDASPAVFSRDASVSIAPGAPRVMLDANGAFAVYAAPAQSPDGLLVGTLRFNNVLTPLQREFHRSAEAQHAPWFAPDFSDQGPLVFRRAEATRDPDVWAEMVTAANAGVLWLTDVPEAERGPAPAVHGAVQFSVHDDAVVVPPAVVARALAARYGRNARYLVPTLDEWASITRKLQLCLTHEYQPEHTPVPATLPGDSLCARVANVAPPVALPQEVARRLPRELCVHRQMWGMSSRGASSVAPLDPAAGLCRPLQRAPSAPDEAALPTVIASARDTFSIEGDASGLFLCIDNDCRSLAPTDGAAPRTLWRAGEAEVRYASSEDAALSSQGVSLLRFVVIDPERDWHPTGLVTSAVAPDVSAWRTLRHDEPDVFGYVRGRQSMTFRATASVAAAALLNAPDATTVLTRALPVVGDEQSRQDAAPPDAALVVLLSREGRCPTENAGVFRRRPAPSPEGLLIDQTVYAFLARNVPDIEPYECLARAAFRVRESRAIAPVPWLHLGLLGDVQMMVFVTAPAALGAALPVGYAHARLPYGFGLDGALSLTAAANFDDAALSRAGAGLSLSLGWGPLGQAPRLLSAGGMLHGATGTGNSNPLASVFVALDLSTLVDLAGGR